MWTNGGSYYTFSESNSATGEVERMMFIIACNHDEELDIEEFINAYAIANRYKPAEVSKYAKACYNDFRSIANNTNIVAMLARCYNLKEV